MLFDGFRPVDLRVFVVRLVWVTVLSGRFDSGVVGCRFFTVGFSPVFYGGFLSGCLTDLVRWI